MAIGTVTEEGRLAEMGELSSMAAGSYRNQQGARRK